MLTSSLDSLGRAIDYVADTFGGVRSYAYAAVSKATEGIDIQANHILTQFYGNGINLVDKKQVEILTDKIQSALTWGQNGIVLLGIGCVVVGQSVPFFNPALLAAAIGLCLIRHDLGVMQAAVWEVKKHLKNNVADDKVTWEGHLSSTVEKCRALLQNNLLLLNRSILFGQEIDLLPDFIGRKIQAALRKEDIEAVKWVPDRKSKYQSLKDYTDGLKEQVAALVTRFAGHLDEDRHLEPVEMQELVKEALRPVAFTRALALTSSIALAGLSYYTPVGSSVAFWGAIPLVLLAGEMHLVHEAIREEVSEPLTSNWNAPLSWNHFFTRIKNACLRAQTTTYLFNKELVFGKEIVKIPDYILSLKKKEDSKVEKAAAEAAAKVFARVESAIDMFRNWTVYASGSR